MDDAERHVVQHVASILRDPEVAELIVAWKELPEHVRLTIGAILEATTTRHEPSSEFSPPFLAGCYLG
jgi:hypothetical protein